MSASSTPAINANLDLNIKVTIIEYHKKGRNVQQIANLLGLSRNTVRRWIQRWQEGSLERRKGGGRPSKAALKHKEILAQHQIQPPPELEAAAAEQSSGVYHKGRSVDPLSNQKNTSNDSHDDSCLTFDDISEPTSSKHTKQTPFLADHEGPIELALKGLSKDQLLDTLKNLFRNHPELEDEISIPAVNLEPLQERLNGLQANIYKSLQSPHLVSKTDHWAFERAAIYLEEFEHFINQQGALLLETKHWYSLIDYVLLAWGYVRLTPLWEAYHHNDPRRRCFKVLANYCLESLKNGIFDRQYLQSMLEKLQAMISDSEDILYSFNFIQDQLNVNF